MRANRLALFLSTAALLGAAPAALAQTPPAAAPAAVLAGDYTDDELAKYGAAYEQITIIASDLNGAAPSAEQQTQMVTAIEASGLSRERFNAIAQASAQDDELAARIAVARTPAPAAGSVAASVTDAELTQFAAAMKEIRPVAVAANGSPSPEQAAQMQAAVQNSGLEVERFNAIAQAVSAEPRLQARIELIDAREAGVGQ